ncbi:MAG: hypothetical protein H6597_07225 [Flavobacteriales bacterium]|nr:hypothetical protein [Flavobacteriales bacterium]MCB9194310.1 hypothetical protein [Flavobacteriales bacterium]
MDRRIRFETKNESNARRMSAFLALSPAERFAWFLRSFDGRKVAAAPRNTANFHGDQRQSGDLDFWIDTTPENFERLLGTLRDEGYEVDPLPRAVLDREQNMSIKMRPDLDVELITRFDPGFTFDEAWSRRAEAELAGHPGTRFQVLHRDDLIASKLRAERPRDLRDAQELQRRNR